MSGYTIAWLSWLGAFGVIEGLALLTKHPGGTLSEHVWRWFAVTDPSRSALVRARRFTLLAFLAWLSIHFLTGGRI